MKSSRTILFVLGTILCNAVIGQGESLRALSTRQLPQAAAMSKVDGVNAYFIYENATQPLPIMDDFSIDRTRQRWAQPDDGNVSLTETIYRIEVAGVSDTGMVFSNDTTFTYTKDLDTPLDIFKVPLPSIQITLRDLGVYPVTEELITAWPAYNVFDTVQFPSPDTLYLPSPVYFQDSLLVYMVAADPGTYLMPDLTVVPLILWEDDDVYVNGTYPIEPPTVGVATFDGLARTGYPYNYPVYTSYGIADQLTSVPIDLELSASDSIYLSFFYQPQGLSGDNNVQPQDSLVLEFYAPDQQTWYRVWSTPYVPMQDFIQVLVPIILDRYLKPDFRMRFLNYATLSGSFDHWHLDYVRLGAQRTFDDTRLIDVAYMMPESSLLQTYTSVPFNKFAQAPDSYMAQSVSVLQRNLDIADRFITYGMRVGLDGGGGEQNFVNGNNTSGNAETIFASDHAINSGTNDFEYDATLSTDFAFWNVKFWTNATPDINRYNDTTRFTQELSNYYAYDDGSAEMGYGLNTNGAKLAYRFDMVGGDSLRAVRMYFNPQANQPPLAQPPTGSFLITVWTSLSPEVIQHQNFSYSAPTYRLDGINHFVEYPLDSALYVQGTFYIGWIQNEVNMNIGFDRNRNNQDKIFKNTTGSFSNTTFQGSLMMRPVFVAAVDPFAAVGEGPSTGSGAQMDVYPNPASDALTVHLDAVLDGGASLQCMDATGRLVMQVRYAAGGSISTAALANGVYVLRAIDRSGASIAQARFIIQH